MSDERLEAIREMRWTERSRHFAREFRDDDEKFLWVQGAAHYNARVEAVAEIDRLRAALDDERGSHAMTFANLSDCYTETLETIADLRKQIEKLHARDTCIECGRGMGLKPFVAGGWLCIDEDLCRAAREARDAA